MHYLCLQFNELQHQIHNVLFLINAHLLLVRYRCINYRRNIIILMKTSDKMFLLNVFFYCERFYLYAFYFRRNVCENNSFLQTHSFTILSMY